MYRRMHGWTVWVGGVGGVACTDEYMGEWDGMGWVDGWRDESRQGRNGDKAEINRLINRIKACAGHGALRYLPFA
jgi:hypothetical protein